MKAFAVALLLSTCLATPLFAQDCVTSENPLVALLDQYSQKNGTRFVVDPRVKAKVTLVGVDSDELDAAVLVGILNIHGFTALTSNGVVYVMPSNVAETDGLKYGIEWTG